MVNPDVNHSVYATDEPKGFSVGDGASASENNTSNGEDYGISPLAATAGLTIGGDAANKQVTIAPGEVGYREHTVSVDVSDVTAYTLTISGPTNLTGPNGATTIGGAGNKQGSSMSDNTWGYGWGETSTAKESLYYQTLFTSGTNLTVPAVSNYAAKFTKKLAFAAKFGSTNTNTGQYKANVTLSLVATPATTTYTITYNANGGSGAPAAQTCTVNGVAGTNCTTTVSGTKPARVGYAFLGWNINKDAATATYSAGASVTISANTTFYAIWQSAWDGTTLTLGFPSITNMQQMTSTICANAKIGDYKDLVDTRDNNTYRVVKFRDERCWMTDNLRLINKTISSTDSDMTSGSFAVPASNTSGFTSGDRSTKKAYLSTSSESNAGIAGYYNWYTATAGVGGSDMASGSVNASICPKGWSLPTGGTGGEYQVFASAESITYSAASSVKLQGNPYNFKYTGYVSDSSFSDGFSKGLWWASTATGDSLNAYRLYISDSNVYPGNGSSFLMRYLGFAVRCIARN